MKPLGLAKYLDDNYEERSEFTYEKFLELTKGFDDSLPTHFIASPWIVGEAAKRGMTVQELIDLILEMEQPPRSKS